MYELLFVFEFIIVSCITSFAYHWIYRYSPYLLWKIDSRDFIWRTHLSFYMLKILWSAMGYRLKTADGLIQSKVEGVVSSTGDDINLYPLEVYEMRWVIQIKLWGVGKRLWRRKCFPLSFILVRLSVEQMMPHHMVSALPNLSSISFEIPSQTYIKQCSHIPALRRQRQGGSLWGFISLFYRASSRRARTT